MYDEFATLELELGEDDRYGDWEMEDMEDLEDWETKMRRPIRRPAARSTARPPIRRTSPFPMGGTMRRPSPGLRPLPPFGHPRRVPRGRYVPRPFPYPGYGPYPAPPFGAPRRPAAVLNRFRFNRATVRPHHLPQIRHLAQRIVASWRTSRPIRTVRLIGHTDNRGSAGFNVNLGERRAKAVGERLVRAINRLQPGLTRRLRIVAQSRGEHRPVASNDTPTGRAQNRRVAVFLSRM